MSAPIIQIQYDNMEEIAACFGRESQRIEQMRQQLSARMVSLQNGGWVGQGADAFFRDMEQDVLPATQRLGRALLEAQSTTLQIVRILREAEEEAAQPFRNGLGEEQEKRTGTNTGEAVKTPSNVGEQENRGIIGWLGTAWDFVEDHRDQIALGGAIVAAGIATVITGGLAAPVIAGALTAGGVTFGINAASSKYPLMDGVIGNTIGGAIIGFGIGSIGSTARMGISKIMSSGITSSGIDFVGQLSHQLYFHNKSISEAIKSINYSDVLLSSVKGVMGAGVMETAMNKAGGILQIGLKKAIGWGAITGMGGDQFTYLLKSRLNPEVAREMGYLSPIRMTQDAAKGASVSAFAYGITTGVNQLHPWAMKNDLYNHIHYQRTTAVIVQSPSKFAFGLHRQILYQPGWNMQSHLGRFFSQLEFGELNTDTADLFMKFVGV